MCENAFICILQSTYHRTEWWPQDPPEPQVGLSLSLAHSLSFPLYTHMGVAIEINVDVLLVVGQRLIIGTNISYI